MRTHLLRTVYPSPAIEAVEPDTGNASNDEDYAPTQAPAATKSAQAPLITVVKTAPVSSGGDDDNDDYYLGGYAGI
jgi:hypothetical protein